ncbi:MAG: ABC transporter permease [Eubacteriaceae bacterium]|nr:ABC transporter permease [Eubacteriaceae bacterium]
MEALEKLAKLWPLLSKGIAESLYMTVASTLMAYAIGLPLGIALVATDKGGLREMRIVNRILGVLINIVRSVPFVILLVAIMPFTRLIVGTTLGSKATVVPLVVGAAPFIARMVEGSLKEVDPGAIEAAQAMGASDARIIFSVMLVEARPSLVLGAAISITTILAYSAMSGFVGGGGLGTIAINYGYYRYRSDVMLVTVTLLVVIVQAFQEIGMRLARYIDKRART